MDNSGFVFEEVNAFSSGITQVATAVPAFVGYTEFARRENESLTNEPTRITTINEFEKYFGHGPKTLYSLKRDDDKLDVKVEVIPESNFLLYRSIVLFFQNGGGVCYIVSVGDYNYKQGVQPSDFSYNYNEKGIATLRNFSEPTMLLIPDAVLFGNLKDFNELQKNMLHFCGEISQKSIAILDVFNGHSANAPDGQDVIAETFSGIEDNLDWGAMYYPFLQTNIVNESDIDYRSLVDYSQLAILIDHEIDQMNLKELAGHKEFTAKLARLKNEDSFDKDLHHTLYVFSVVYKRVIEKIKIDLNVLPPSGAVAGLITMVDNTRSISCPPMRVPLIAVTNPLVNVSEEIQKTISDQPHGKMVNFIKGMAGMGTVVTGAGTLAGNHELWRDLSVKRTAIMIEQSCRQGVKSFISEPNTGETRGKVNNMIANFLHHLWSQGSLDGKNSQESFTVEVKEGVSDKMDYVMDIAVQLQLVGASKPFRFSFQQEVSEEEE